MYNAFFDFREKPFKLVPNPEFLFLSQCHEEALAHLTYATSQGDGFVEITGEVGTGKTTLCRVFLEDLDKDIEAAFIFNSKLDSVQLLRAINKELGIVSLSSDPVELTNELGEFLLEKKSQGKSVILLIDEAQNLGHETLEQLRLLSNLETTKNKLLQIILVGQPELSDILDSYDLRQLRQRINLSCHIHPMTFKETCDYIIHRVNVASLKPQTLFSRKVQKDIYRFSAGIPRLINIICDRCLLAAYSLNKKKVTPSILKLAQNELRSYTQNRSHPPVFWKRIALFSFFTMFFMIIAYTLIMKMPLKTLVNLNSDMPLTESLDHTLESTDLSKPIVFELNKPVQKIDQTGQANGKTDFSDHLVENKKQPKILDSQTIPESMIEKMKAETLLSRFKDHTTRENVLSHIISMWDNEPVIPLNPLIQHIKSNSQFFKMTAAQYNFQVLYLLKDHGFIRDCNLPAIFGYKLPDTSTKGFIGLVNITSDNEYVIFPGMGEKTFKVNPIELIPYLTGETYILWKDNYGYDRVVSETSSKNSILSLKLFLKDIGFSDIEMTPIYDSLVLNSVKQIQAKYGIVEDGLVGPLTKIMLYNEKKEKAVPYLDRTRFMDHQ